MVRHFKHFELICTAKYRYSDKFLHRKIKFRLHLQGCQLKGTVSRKSW
jgi:hypothetical protein